MSTTAPLHVGKHNTCSLTKMMRKTVKRGTSIPVALHRVPCDGQEEYGHVHPEGVMLGTEVYGHHSPCCHSRAPELRN